MVEESQKRRILILIALFAGLFGGVVGILSIPDFLDYSYEPVVNNTNLAPDAGAPHPPGTGERIQNLTYNASDYPLDLHVFAHAESVFQTAKVFVYVNETLICPRSGRPLGTAENAYRGCDITIPKGASYRVNITNYHHYEWYEYPYAWVKIR
jgi:hypothetical protein